MIPERAVIIFGSDTFKDDEKIKEQDYIDFVLDEKAFPKNLSKKIMGDVNSSDHTAHVTPEFEEQNADNDNEDEAIFQKFFDKGSETLTDETSIVELNVDESLRFRDSTLGIEYRIDKLGARLINRWSMMSPSDFAELDVPQQNKFIPYDFDLVDPTPIPSVFPSRDWASTKLLFRAQSLLNLADGPQDNSTAPGEAPGNETNTTSGTANTTSQTAHAEKIKAYVSSQSPPPTEDSETDYPTILRYDESGVLWYKLDRSFRVPRFTVFMEFDSPIAYISPKEAALTLLIAKMLKDALDEEAYDAYLAGNTLEIYGTLNGLEVLISGFTAKLADVLELVLERLKNPKFDPGRFNALKATLIEELGQESSSKSGETEKKLLEKLLRKYYYVTSELQDALSSIELQELESFFQKLMERSYLNMLVMGNALNTTAIELMDKVIQQLSLKPAPEAELLPERILDLSNASLVFRNFSAIRNNQSDHALLNYYQFGPRNLTVLANLWALTSIMESELSTYLLSEVNSTGMRSPTAKVFSLFGVDGVLILLSGGEIAPHVLNRHIEKFLGKFEGILANQTSKDLEIWSQTLIGTALEKDKTLEERAKRYWNEITTNSLEFGRKEFLAKQVTNLKKSELQAIYHQLFQQDCRRLSIQLYSATESTYLPSQVLSDQECYCKKNEAMVANIELFGTMKRYSAQQ
eukprot:TRINITY_DN13618_c0_g3_i2.p1 TRINITY_DN13618_c0_g3~~TRINITY_DN13618_c0_g3_i2.p1  ORF type:complete len:693 (+),score=146.95 TRINITY_DN13618_c0_g3_i2:148-2226(+)